VYVYAGSVPLSTCKSALLLLLFRWLAATNKPTSSPTCKSAQQPSSIDIQVLLGVNVSLSHVHISILLLLFLSAFSWPGASDPAPYSCHPYPLTPVTRSPVPSPYTPYSCLPIPVHPSTDTRQTMSVYTVPLTVQYILRYYDD